MKEYSRKKNRTYYRPYTGSEEAAYGPRRKSHFCGLLRNTSGMDFKLMLPNHSWFTCPTNTPFLLYLLIPSPDCHAPQRNLE
jgi:hypothetical protein